jgi:phage terminase large subunit-like protein
MSSLASVPKDWRELDLAAKARLRWRLKSRSKQLTPPIHALCDDPSLCEEIIQASHKLYPQRYQAPEREHFQLINGHIPWFIWLILAGRGWGKTRTGAEDIARSMNESAIRVALVGPTFADGRDTMVEGESGLLSVIPKSLIENWNRSIGELILKNGSRAKIFSAEEPQRLRGPQHHRAWCDEIAAWRYLQATWDMLMFGLRLGREPKVIITTTPKPYRFIRRMVAQATDPKQKVVLTTGSTFENKRNLPTVVIDKLTETYEGTRLGRQELDAEVLEDLAGGIIKIADIDAMRLSHGDVRSIFPTSDIRDLIDRIVVAIDPAVTANKTSNETGIVVAGRSLGPCPICSPVDNPRRRPHAFVLEDVTEVRRLTEAEWSQNAILAHRRWFSDKIVGEVNNGGDLVEAVVRAVDGTIPFDQVRASRGKVQRAEPIGALYERHEVHHVGKFPKLEDQLCRLGIDPEDEEDPDPDDEDSSSPDRADACVWALSELMIPEARITTTSGTAQDQRGHGDR